MREPKLFIVAILIHLTSSLQPSCSSFYCFITPSWTEKLDIERYENVSCTHFVYGFSHQAADHSLRDVSTLDRLSPISLGNMRNFLSLRESHPQAKLLLGLRRSGRSPIRDGPHAKALAQTAVNAVEKRRFDGLFLHFDGNHLDSPHAATFLETVYSASLPTLPTLAVSPMRMYKCLERLRDMSEYVEHIYLLTEELPSSEDPYTVMHLDPLLPTSDVHPEDTIKGSVDKLIESGILADRIVVGLTVGARSYKVRTPNSVKHGAYSKYTATKLTWQDVCKLNETGKIIKDVTSLQMINGSNWLSANAPDEDILGKKIEWISKNGLGGIGLSSLQADDPDNKCGGGEYPAHKLVPKHLSCTRREIVRRASARCPRLCYLDSSSPIPLSSLQPNWCSHVVIGPFDIELTDLITPSPKTILLWKNVTEWRRELGKLAPKVILSIGANQPNDIWRIELANPFKKPTLINSIVKLAKKLECDGIEISWTLGSMDSIIDAGLLNSFLIDFRKALPKETQILLAVTSTSSFNNRYDIAIVKNTTDLVILHSHRLWSSRQPFTGHHSPLFMLQSELVGDNTKTVEGFAADWSSKGFPNDRLILSLTAEALSMTTIGSRSIGENPFGIRAEPSLPGRDVEGTITSQTQICQMTNDNSTTIRWLPDLAVPILLRENQFVAYDNDRSARIKASWSSSQGFGGLAIHGLHMDNPFGICPTRTFPILRSIVETQVCGSCVPISSQPAFKTCTPKFKLACNYRLPEKDEQKALTADQVPWELCTEVVVEEAVLLPEGNVTFDKDHIPIIKKLKEDRLKINNRGLIMALKCDMNQTQLTVLLTNMRHKLLSSLESAVVDYGFTGIELRCANLVNKNNKMPFSNFLRLLRPKLNVRKTECPTTLTLRLSALTASLRNSFDISSLNGLDHIVLETFLAPKDDEKAAVLSPLFPVHQLNSTLSIDTTIREWELAGLDREKILLQIPSYGIEQKLLNATSREAGDKSTKVLSLLPQAELCKRIKRIGTKRKTDWESVSNTAITNNGYWMPMGEQDTVKYKMRYSLREGLAGVGLMTLNEDDHAGVCGSGAFPILHSIATRCH